MDFTERFELYKEGGMINDEDIKDLNAVIDLFKKDYGITLEEENASMFIAHLCAAYGRLSSNEPVDEVPEELVELTNEAIEECPTEAISEVTEEDKEEE